MKRFVYHEWDILCEDKNTLTKSERLIVHKHVPLRNMNTFGVKLQEARIKNRMTIEHLANEINVDPKTIMMFETGIEAPSTDTKLAFEKLFNLE